MTSLRLSEVFDQHSETMRSKSFPGRLENLEKISDFIVQAAKEAGLDDSATYAVQLAVDEAATNIIEHAYRGTNQGIIICSYDVLKDGIKIVLKDQGRPFDPQAVPEPNIKVPLEDLKPRGLGLYMMRKVMDDIRFEFSPKHGNTLTMFKRKKKSLNLTKSG